MKHIKHPVLSIIIPVYNSPSSVKAISQHILDQNFKDFELILIDDGSTDSTPAELEALKHDPRVIVIRQSNKGPAAARNNGLTNAKGDYIMFMDADDEFEDSMISVMVDAISNGEHDLIVCGWKNYHTLKEGGVQNAYIEISPENKVLNGSRDELKLHVMRSLGTNGILYNLWNKIFKTEIIKSHKLLFREDISFGEDLLFVLKYLNHCDSLRMIPTALYKYYTGNPGSVFKKSSLEPKYRFINSEELMKFAGKTRGQELDDLSQWVLWRWLLSYWMIVSGSQLSYAEKIKLLRLTVSGSPLIAKSIQYIGCKKWLIEWLIYLLRLSPHLSFVGAWCILAVKNLMKLRKFNINT